MARKEKGRLTLKMREGFPYIPIWELIKAWGEDGKRTEPPRKGKLQRKPSALFCIECKYFKECGKKGGNGKTVYDRRWNNLEDCVFRKEYVEEVKKYKKGSK